MGIPILIVTRTPAFGELAQQHLMIHGVYTPVLTDTGETALRMARKTSFEAAILDHDLTDKAQVELAEELRKISPRIRLVVVPPQNNPELLHWHGIIPDAFLTKPFFYLDLLKIVEAALQKDADTDSIIALKPGDETPDALDRRSSSSGLAASEPSLAQQTEVNTPKNHVRLSGHLSRLIASSPAQAALIIRQEHLVIHSGNIELPDARLLVKQVKKLWQPEGGDVVGYYEFSSGSGEVLFYAAPLPEERILVMLFNAETPFGIIRSAAKLAARLLSAALADSTGEADGDLPALDAAVSLDEDEGGPPAARLPPLFDDIPPPTAEPRLDEPQTVQGAVVNSAVQYQDSEAGQEDFASAPMDLYRQNYACLLIPLLPQHPISAPLAHSLSRWLPQLCQVFGWRLLHLSIEPDYLHWVVDVPPATSPARMVQLIRQHTSSRILPGFPSLFEGNATGDFWSSTFLMTSSSSPLPDHLIRAFLQQTHHRQMAE